MRHGAVVDDETVLFDRSRNSEPVRIETHEVRYLDLSGDGIPDAVEHINRSAHRAPGSSVVDVVDETRRLEYGIGVNGKPAGIRERTTSFVRDATGRLHIAHPGRGSEMAQSA